MTIQQALKKVAEKFKAQNISSASLDAEVLLLEALNRIKPHSYNSNVNDIKHKIVASSRSIGTPRNDNKNLDKSWLYINNDYILNKKEEKLFNSFVNQRLKHKPVAYIINRKEFFGYDFYVDENVLIPRPETELIVEEVLEILTGVHTLVRKNSDLNKINSYKLKPELRNFKYPIDKKFNLIDIGTGSGCIIISILNELAKNKNGRVIRSAYANDISQKAIKTAKVNAKKYNLSKKIKFIANDFEKFIKKEFSSTTNQFIITANLPYVENDEYKKLFPNVKKYEPRLALAGGKDGLDLIKRLVNAISEIKTESESLNYILLEADQAQMKKIESILKRKLNIIDTKTTKDLRGKNRLILAKI